MIEMNKCQIQIEAYERGETDIFDQNTYELDRDDIMDALMYIRELSAKYGKNITHFEIQIICDGDYYDGGSIPPFKEDFQFEGD